MSSSKNIFLTFIILMILFGFSLEIENLRIKEEDPEKEEKEETEVEKPNVNPPKFSKISGFYPDDFKLKLISEENNEIYYTDDSTDPRTSESAQKYEGYILIYDKSLEPNIYSAIGQNDSSPVSICIMRRYTVPQYPVDKAMIIRAAAKNSKGEFSEVITKTYFVTNEKLYYYQDLVVISLVTNPENLFDPDIGIYVTGNQYQEALRKAIENNETETFNARKAGSNFQNKGKEWERESFITIFDKGEINLQQKIGLRIKGAYTRMYPSKSFNIYAKKKYGKSKFETDILKDNYDINGNLITSYKAFSLRNIYDSGRLRDKIGRDLFISRKDLTYTNMRNAVLFLNGEYWGLYLIQEKLDSDFLSSHYLLSKKKIDVAKVRGFEEGEEEHYNDFLYFCGNYSEKDVSDEKIYSEIKDYINIDSFAELFANGIYISNTDWPGNNDGEWKYFGKPKEGNEYADGKWRFYIYDLDYSMSSPNTNSFISIERKTKYPYVRLYLNLIKNNSDFRHKVINTICDYANTIRDNDLINQLIEEYKEENTDLVANSQLRWSSRSSSSVLEAIANNKANYYRALDSFFNYYDKRPNFIYQHIKQYLKLKGNPVNLTVEIQGKGQVQVNSIVTKFKNDKWTGTYFSRIPISIKAIPVAGYNFKEWAGYINSTQINEELLLFDSSKIIAIFE